MHRSSWICAWRVDCERCWVCWGAVMFTARSAEKKDQKNGIMDGSWTTTMPEVAWLWQCSNSWRKNQRHSFCSHCICPNLAPGDFLSFPRLKMGFWNQLLLTVEMQCNSQPVHHTQEVSKSACKLCKTDRARVCLQKGCTLRAFRHESTVLEIFKLYRLLPGTFWYSHIHKLTVHWT